MTEEEDRHARRLGYWLRSVREARQIALKDAAVAAGLSAKSGSTVSFWEHGKRPIKVQHLRRLALYYRVPESLFTDPPMTDEERLAAVLSDAEALERGDWDAGTEGGPRGAGGRGDVPRRPH
jgi:transcriptional regulator with XRE-family HTH domain